MSSKWLQETLLLVGLLSYTVAGLLLGATLVAALFIVLSQPALVAIGLLSTSTLTLFGFTLIRTASIIHGS